MKIAIAQLNVHIGNFDGNVAKMLKAVDTAKEQGADLVCFSELVTCGYPPRDFLEFDDFIDQAEAAIEKLAAAAKGIAIVVGTPSRNPVIEGKDLFNSAFFLEDGKVKQIINKALLPTYDVFDEYRYFEPGNEFNVVEFKGKKIAVTVCEDIWNIGNENPLYTICPMDELMPQNPDFILNLSASPFSYTQAESRIHVVRANIDKYGIPMFYVNHSGAQTELIFDGGSIVMSPNGKIHDELPYFEECIRTYELADVIKGAESREREKNKMELIHDAIVLGIKDYFGKLGFKKAILGLSGGIDSAVTAVLAVRALGKENVRVVLMPSQFSSDHSVNDARDLAENMGIQYDIVEIKGIYETYMKTLAPQFEGLEFNITEENLQARSRGMILMAMSNKFELARYMNKDGEVIPVNTITKPPSAELRPNQKDSDSLPDYDILDEVLFQYIEKQQGPKEIIEMGFDEKLVRRILRLVNINEFKRYQTAPVIRVSTKAFGMGRRMPIVGKYLS